MQSFHADRASCTAPTMRRSLFLELCSCFNAAILLLAWPVFAQSAGAPGTAAAAPQQVSTPAVPSPSTLAQAVVKRIAGSEQEGIRVHGHWVIEVRNPDGAITARREFENSLQSTGASALASFLVGREVPGAWSVYLNGQGLAGGTAEAGPCVPFSGVITTNGKVGPVGTTGPASGTACVLTVAPNPQGDGSDWTSACEQAAPVNTGLGTQAPPCSMNLTVSGPPLSSSITLAGNVTATSAGAGTITDVETSLSLCVGSNSLLSSPGNCATLFNNTGGTTSNLVFGGDRVFTSRLLDGLNGDPAAVPYTPGQVINVVVTLSFQ